MSADTLCCANCGSWADKADARDGYCTLCREVGRAPQHTPGPWRVQGAFAGASFNIVNQHGSGLASMWARAADTTGEEEANARRIVACVNACEGINPEAVPDLLAACRQAHQWACGQAPYGTNPWLEKMEAAIIAAMGKREFGKAARGES